MSTFSWDLNAGNTGGGSDNKAEFLKFPEGITRIRVIDDAPYQRWTHFMRKHNRSINCPGRGCPICEIRRQEKANKQPYTHQMAKRFALNVINRETSRVEILEQGKTFIQDLIDIRSDLAMDGHDLKDADIKVRRRGTGQDDTSYRLDVDKVYPTSADDETLIKNKINLEEYFKPHTNEQIMRILQGEDWATVMSGEKEEQASQSETEHVGEEEDIEIR
jgi:hypothetical protein